MGRHNKQGLDYFSLDTEMDDKIFIIEAKHELQGFAVFIKLLQRIYRDGYYCEFKDRERLVFCRKHNIKPALLDAVLSDCLAEGIFDEDLFKSKKILTSDGIQKRYFEATKRRGKILVDKNVIKIDVSEYSNVIFVGKNGINDNIKTQSKVNESKVNESKGTKKNVTSIPIDFTISERVSKWAKEKGFTQLEEHLESFKRKVAAKGYQYIDWDSAFMEAIREDWAKLRQNQKQGEKLADKYKSL